MRPIRIMLSRTSSVSILLMVLGAAALLVTGGCATQPQGLSLVSDADQYDAAFDGTIEALRDARFRLERVDRRLGVIVTQPRDSGSILEPWRGDNATVGLAMESTLQHQRHRIRIQFRPASGAAGTDATMVMTEVTPNPPPFEPASYDGPLRIEVECWIDRLHRPGRRIETSSLRFSRTSVDPSLAARGVPGYFWEPVERDRLMEDRIAQRIARTTGSAVAEVRRPAPAANDG